MPDDAMNGPQPTDDGPRCGASTPHGPCGNWAGKGTDHVGYGACKFHCGSTRNGRLAGLRQQAVATVRGLGLQVDVAPDDALLVLVRMAAANVAYLGGQVVKLGLPGVSSERSEGDLYAANHLGDAVPHVLVGLYGDWCDRLGRYAKLAVDAGVAQRHIELAEETGRLIASVVRSILGDPDLALSEAQRELAPAVAHRHLSALAAVA